MADKIKVEPFEIYTNKECLSNMSLQSGEVCGVPGGPICQPLNNLPHCSVRQAMNGISSPVCGTSAQSKLGENVMARLCMHRIRLMGPRWYKAVSHMRVAKKKKEKKKMFQEDDYERLDEAKTIAFDMIPEDLVDIAGTLLKKVFKEVQEESKELLILAWLSGCAGAEELASAQDRCVFTQPDGKGKMKRIDGLRGSDKVWRLDTLVAILFHGVPMDSTDTNLLVHRCEEELCVNPHHFMFQCTSAMVAVVSEMLKLRGFQIVQCDPLLEGSALASDRDMGNYQFTSPFNISTIQREVHQNLDFPNSALDKFSLSPDDIAFIHQHLPKSLLNEMKFSANATAVPRRVADACIAPGGPPPPAHVRSPCSLSSSEAHVTQNSQHRFVIRHGWPDHHPAAVMTTYSPDSTSPLRSIKPDSSCDLLAAQEALIPNFPTIKRQPLNDSPDSQMPIKKRRLIPDNCSSSHSFLVKSDPEPGLMTSTTSPINESFIRNSSSLFQPIRQCQPCDDKEIDDEERNRSTKFKESTSSLESEDSSRLMETTHVLDNGMLNANATEQEMEDINNRSEMELRRRVHMQQQHYLAAWQNIVARSPFSSPIADMINLGVPMTSPLSFWAPQSLPTVPSPTLGGMNSVNSGTILARPKPLLPLNMGRDTPQIEAAASPTFGSAAGQEDAFVPIRSQPNTSEAFISHHMVAAAVAAHAAHSRGTFSPLSGLLRSTPIPANPSAARLTPMILDDYMKLNYQRSSYPYREINELSHFLRAQPGTTGCTPTFSMSSASGLTSRDSPALAAHMHTMNMHQQLAQHRRSVTSMLSCNNSNNDFSSSHLPVSRPNSALQQRFCSKSMMDEKLE